MFCDAVQAELPDFGGTHVKTIGDALMLRVPDPGRAVLLGLRIAHDVMPGHGAPAVGVGLHHGPAIERDADYFGAAVNLAARVSGAATGGEVLLTAQTAALAPHVDRVLYESRGCQSVRNVRDPVESVVEVRQGHTTEHRLSIDPVCRMAVDPGHAAGRLVVDDTTYFFCSLTRAEAERLDAHASELARIVARPDVLTTGISAADTVGLHGGSSAVEVYAPVGQREALIAEHALEPGPGPVRIRWVRDAIWPLLDQDHDRRAPRAAVFVDLLEHDDPRARREAARALKP